MARLLGLLLVLAALLAPSLGAATQDARDQRAQPEPQIAVLGQSPALPGTVALPSIRQLAACCKTCRKGKACGDSCISRDKTCHQPPGCACDAQ